MRQLAQRGCRVVAAVRSPPAAPPLLRELEGVTVTELDVTRPDSVQRWAAAVAELAPHADVSGAAGSALGLGLGAGAGAEVATARADAGDAAVVTAVGEGHRRLGSGQAAARIPSSPTR